jgi:ABC-type transport system involved in Fe-S cluster assembly fused permease/ATPase subunit
VFRHIHALSLRFHLERRTGALTKIVERGTKSIDMMLSNPKLINVCESASFHLFRAHNLACAIRTPT